jgi:hypothetical protein
MQTKIVSESCSRGTGRRIKPVNDPKEVTGENDDLRRINGLSRHVSVALRILIYSDCTREEVRQPFLFSHWHRCVGQRAKGNRPECVSHQFCSYKFVRKSPCSPNRNFNLAKCLKDCRVVLTTQKRRIDPSGYEWTKLTFGKQVCFSIFTEVRSRFQPLCASRKKEPLAGWCASGIKNPSPCSQLQASISARLTSGWRPGYSG